MAGPGYGSPIPPVQMLRAGVVEKAGDANEIGAAAVGGPPQALPHVEAIQRSFGRHDLSGVRAHVGGAAADAASAMGAEAFATGNDVAFRQAPDLHTAAHEAAHIVQQRGGVQLEDNVGREGDRYEQHADEVADRVVRGNSAEDLLDEAANTRARSGASPNVGGGAPGLQKRVGGRAAPTVEKVEDYLLTFGQDDFVVSFELLRGADANASVRAILQPANIGRAYQSEKKYWDVRGREVGSQDRWTSMGAASVPAVPFESRFGLPDPTSFRGSFPRESSSGASKVYTFDIDGDGRPEFGIRCEVQLGQIDRNYSFTVRSPDAVDQVGFHFYQDDAWKHMHGGGGIAPRREKDDFFDALVTLVDVGVGMIPVVGDIVDLAEALTGYTKWGGKMTTAERAITGLAVLIPFAGGAAARQLLQGGAALADAAAKMARNEDEIVAALRAIEARSGDRAWIDEMHVAVKAGRDLSRQELERLARLLHQVDAEKRVFRAAEAAAGAEGVLRRGGKVAAETGPVSIKRLRNVLGRAGVSPSPYHLRKATKADAEALKVAGTDMSSVYAWVSRDGAGKVLRDHRGRPIITFTEQGLSTLEEAVKSFGHEVQHLKDFAAGRGSTEAGAERAGEELWELVTKARE